MSLSYIVIDMIPLWGIDNILYAAASFDNDITKGGFISISDVFPEGVAIIITPPPQQLTGTHLHLGEGCQL